MKYLKENHLSLLIILWLVVSGVVGFNKPVFNAGAVKNPLSTFTNPVYLSQGQTNGGAIFSTTSSGTVTLTNTDITQNETILYSPNITGAVLTLPTKANLTGLNPAFIPNAGDRITKWIFNATSTDSAVFTIAGNTGVILQVASSSVNLPTVTGNITTDAMVRLDFMRMSTSTDIYVQATYYK